MSSNSSNDVNKAFDSLIVNLAALTRARKDDISEELRRAKDLNDANKYVRDIGTHLSRKEAKIEVKRLSAALKQLEAQRKLSEKIYDQSGSEADLQRAQRAGSAADRVQARRDSLAESRGIPLSLFQGVQNFANLFTKPVQMLGAAGQMIEAAKTGWQIGEDIKENGVEVFSSFGLGGVTNQRDMRHAQSMQKEQGAAVSQFYNQLRNLKDEKEYDSTRESLMAYQTQLLEERDSKGWNETAQTRQLDGTIAQIENLLKQSNLINRDELVKKGQATRDASVADEIRRKEAMASGDKDTLAQMNWMDTYNRMLSQGVSEDVAQRAANAQSAVDLMQSQPKEVASFNRMEIGGAVEDSMRLGAVSKQIPGGLAEKGIAEMLQYLREISHSVRPDTSVGDDETF